MTAYKITLFLNNVSTTYELTADSAWLASRGVATARFDGADGAVVVVGLASLICRSIIEVSLDLLIRGLRYYREWSLGWFIGLPSSRILCLSI